MQHIIYFDNSATTPIYPEALKEMNRIYDTVYGNPSSLHKMGSEAEKVLQNSRETIAQTLGVSEGEIFFTSGGTEANNWAIKGAARANKKRGCHILTSNTEHPSILECYQYLKTEGFADELIQTDACGLLDSSKVFDSVTDQTILISFILVNNETGAMQNAEELVMAIRRKKPSVLIHIDAVQAYGKIPLNLSRLGADLVSVSSHKIHGPKGCGFLYVKKNTRILPILHGGGQEKKLRSGTENAPAVAGFATAAKIIHEQMADNHQKVRQLKTILVEGLNRCFGNGKYFLNSPENAYEGIVSLSFPRVKAQVLMQHLEAQNIFVSVGSACSSRKNIQSHVLKAMGLTTEHIEGAIRVSFSGLNTEEEVHHFLDIIKQTVPKIQY